MNKIDAFIFVFVPYIYHLKSILYFSYFIFRIYEEDGRVEGSHGLATYVNKLFGRGLNRLDWKTFST